MNTPDFKPWSETKLANCPFCGSRSLSVAYAGQPALALAVECTACKARSPQVASLSGTDEVFNSECVYKWNQRKAAP